VRTLFWTAVFLLDREDGRHPGPGCLLMVAGGVVTVLVATHAGWSP
jgi:hypothetical protein